MVGWRHLFLTFKVMIYHYWPRPPVCTKFALKMASRTVNALLQDVAIEGVELINDSEELGSGAYGRVFTVKYRGEICAAKEIHSIFIAEGVSQEDKETIIGNFVQECRRCSAIRHRNIVEFLGVYCLSTKPDIPVMVMELMDTSLTKYVENNKSNISMTTKFSILHDVSLGLKYLHTLKPAVIHRDLSPNNVMLTSQLVAKIGDLGVAKVIQVDSRQTRSKLTRAPGTVHFMPPEALEANPTYGTAVDVFSFAGIVLHVFAEKWPKPSVQKRRNPVTRKLVALSEVERRQEYLDTILEFAIVLKQLVERCLDDDPYERPNINEVSEMIEALKVTIII